jgi:hypothetical protein
MTHVPLKNPVEDHLCRTSRENTSRAFSCVTRSRHSDYVGAAGQPVLREAGPRDNPG